MDKELFEFIKLIKTTSVVEADEIIELIDNFTSNQYDNFYLLVNSQDNYYTIFQTVSKNGEYSSLSSAILNCLESYGDIKYINLENSTVTIITDDNEGDDEINIFYFMPFDEGIVTVNK